LNHAIKKLFQTAAAFSVIAAAVLFAQPQSPSPQVRFAIVGDRTGETQPGIYEAIWEEMAAARPDFVVGIGDSIQGMDDGSMEKEWQSFQRILTPYRSIPFYPAPGNHDVWSASSAKSYERFAGHPLHYGFDYGPAHFTVLDNSRTEDLSQEEIVFLNQDLKAHESQPVKFIVSHRPSWVINVMLHSPTFPLHQLAKTYGVRGIIAGHVHEMLHMNMEGIDYISAPSAGGHLRASAKYEDGWFFGYILATVNGTDVTFEVRELPPPHGVGRVTPLAAWGPAGLINSGR
jgi:3',5'-cyclic AMP phosphodiesterase CpdA